MDKYASVADMLKKDYTIGNYGNGVKQLRNKETGEFLYTWSENGENHFPPVATYEEALENVKV